MSTSPPQSKVLLDMGGAKHHTRTNPSGQTSHKTSSVAETALQKGESKRDVGHFFLCLSAFVNFSDHSVTFLVTFLPSRFASPLWSLAREVGRQVPEN